MEESLKKFGFTMFMLTVILISIGYALFLLLIPESYFTFFPFVPFFIFAVTTLVHLFLVKASDNDPRKFTTKYLAAMGVKLLVYIIFIIIFLAVATENAVSFLISFLVSYAFFTLVEVISILKFLKSSQ